MKPVRKEPLHFGRPTLRERGWTDGLIARFLPDPDATAPNPHYRCAPPRKLYLIARVEAVEQSDAFQQAVAAAAARKQASGRAVATKRDRMREHVEGVRFVVPSIGRHDLIRLACEHYNRRQEDRAMGRDRYDYREATPASESAFLERIGVNYLRHVVSPYHRRLDEVAGRVGVDMAYLAIVGKVLDAIAAAHPWLAAECWRQKAARATGGGEPS